MDKAKELPPIKVKNKAKKFIKRKLLVKQIADQLKTVPGIQDLKGDQELTEAVCQTVIDHTKDNDERLKMEAVLDVVRDVFTNLDNHEFEAIKKQIEYLFENKIVKKRFLSKLLGVVVKTIPSIVKIF
jgi:Cu/Ag efflux pump CusA